MGESLRMGPQLEIQILERGKEFFQIIGKETPSIFRKNWWTGKVMDWCMKHEDFKIQLFRFIDVLPYLTTTETLGRHLQEYFTRNKNVPAVFKAGIQSSRIGGKLGTKVLGATIRKNIESMALQFIIGDTVSETITNLIKLRDNRFAFTLDILGEATVSEKEAEEYVQNYHELLDGLAKAQPDWPSLEGGDSELDWGSAPKVNVSIKPSALYSQAHPAYPEATVGHMLERLKPIYRKVIQMGGFLCIDTEMKKLKEITFELYRRLRSDSEFREYPHLGLAMQVYLKEADNDVDQMLAWARQQRLPISIRLLKGAYWDYEVVIARQNGWPPPVFTVKAQSDAAFERNARKILENHDLCHLACASHNVRSVCMVMETARQVRVPEDRYEFQALYGMAEPFRNALLKMTDRVRLYCPHGKLLPGMAYLIRRLLENTSNESFLRQTFVEEVEMERLLENPEVTLQKQTAETESTSQPYSVSPSEPSGFINEPLADFSLESVRDAFPSALVKVKTRLGKTYPLHINGKDVTTDDVIDSVNPADPDQVIGRVCQAGTQEIENAIIAAKEAFVSWRDTSPRERAAYLVQAAQAARSRIYELAAWQILEAGKQWNQAYNDVCEAIDFLEFYAREMIRLAEPAYLGNLPGEVNEYFYQPKGIAAVIAPWNFPLAISCGMCAAAIVAGNCVIYKPSNQTPIIGHTLLQILQSAKLPAGVFNYTPGRGSVMGDYLVEHPDIALIAFTGSMETGLRIVERAGRTPENQSSVKKVIAEMGGKNAIIIDDDADLDEAVPQVLDSAFAYQGQKCSACSRVIVLENIYDRFVERLLDAARSLKIGPAEDPTNFMGPVINTAARNSIQDYIEIATSEGNLLYSSEIPNGDYYIPITIVDAITPAHRIAQEEVFGPVLALMRAENFDQALEWANSTRFALTGGLFSRSPENLERARREFRVGNLYFNRGNTGALVERQPFGGFKMSGVGSKAGGRDYLLHFMDPRTVTENTMRRGFVALPNSIEVE